MFSTLDFHSKMHDSIVNLRWKRYTIMQDFSNTENKIMINEEEKQSFENSFKLGTSIWFTHSSSMQAAHL